MNNLQKINNCRCALFCAPYATNLFSSSSRNKGVFISPMTFPFTYCTTVLSYFYLVASNVNKKIRL
jgi:hypothetical protein